MRKILLLLLACFLLTGLTAQSKKGFKKSTKKHRKHYKTEFAKDERSPFYEKKKALKKLKFYKADAAYEVKCKFERSEDVKPFPMATYSGKTKQYIKYGTLSFVLNGDYTELAVYQNMFLRKMPNYKDHLFLPFKDDTNSEETYGGGRYIDLKTTDIKDGKVILDFNKCYNPWCAYSDGYNCPIPPVENHLEMKVEAGEKVYEK